MLYFKVTLTIYDDQLIADMASATCRVTSSEIEVAGAGNLLKALFDYVYQDRGEYQNRLSSLIAQALWDGSSRVAFTFYGVCSVKTACLTWKEKD